MSPAGQLAVSLAASMQIVRRGGGDAGGSIPVRLSNRRHRGDPLTYDHLEASP
jgi:hypothetical protein